MYAERIRSSRVFIAVRDVAVCTMIKRSPLNTIPSHSDNTRAQSTLHNYVIIHPKNTLAEHNFTQAHTIHTHASKRLRIKHAFIFTHTHARTHAGTNARKHECTRQHTCILPQYLLTRPYVNHNMLYDMCAIESFQTKCDVTRNVFHAFPRRFSRTAFI